MAYSILSPAKYACIVNLKPVLNMVSISIEHDADTFTKYSDINGEYRFVENLDTSGMLTVEIMDFSASNDDFMLHHKTKLPFTISFIDKSSNATAFSSDSCVLQKLPPLARQAEGGTVTYTFMFGAGDINISGAKEL